MEDVVCEACADQTSWVLECAQPRLDRIREGSEASLPQANLDHLLVVIFQGVVDNGGFQYLFERNLPPGIPYARVSEALGRIGAADAAECLDRAVAMFPFENPELDPERRIAFMLSQREDPERRDGPLDRLGDRAIELSPFTYRHLANYLQAKGLAPPN